MQKDSPIEHKKTNDKMVSFMLPESLRNKLKDRYIKTGISRSRQVRDALEAYFNRLAKDKKD